MTNNALRAYLLNTRSSPTFRTSGKLYLDAPENTSKDFLVSPFKHPFALMANKQIKLPLWIQRKTEF